MSREWYFALSETVLNITKMLIKKIDRRRNFPPLYQFRTDIYNTSNYFSEAYLLRLSQVL